MTMWNIFRQSAPASTEAVRSARRRTLIWAVLAAMICGLLEIGQPVEDAMRAFRNRVRQHPASGEVVVVGIDQRSIKAIGAWPWPRSKHAELVDRLNALGARSISFDLSMSEPTDRREDKAFVGALSRSKAPVTLAVFGEIAPNTKVSSAAMPMPAFREHSTMASVKAPYNYLGHVWRLPYRFEAEELIFPSMSAQIAGVAGRQDVGFLIDYAIDPNSVPTFSSVDVLTNGTRHADISGRDVVVGITHSSLGDMVLAPGFAEISGVYLHALGVETLRSGTPRDGGWLPALAFVLMLTAFCLRQKRLQLSLWLFAGSALLVLGLPFFFDSHLLSFDVVPAFLMLLIVSFGTSWTSLRRSYRTRGTVNAQSGLLNLDALRMNNGGSDCILIAARVGNYPQIAAALSADEETALVGQIAQRLTIGSAEHALYQGDEGIFAWFTPATDIDAIGEHLDALHGFFRESLNLGDKQVDLAICFGVDTGGNRSPANRLGSALVACEEAAAEGIKWKAFDPAALVDASWKLSLLGQLDRAIESGDFWVAYQPKLDLKSGRVVGAEALARWTHPIKGAISPVDFILAAEQSDRIERLTRFVLDRAITAAAAINDAGCPFNVAVNLSTRLIGDPALTQMVAEMLDRHGLAPHHLTLEVTETAAIGTGGTNLDTLVALRKLGVRISIDDYGTGLSTLEYLKKIPATEIKIDQSFVGAITKSSSDRLMVHSTIQLVHSLGHVVVAEGVEDQATRDALSALDCDYAQGYFIGRPVSFDEIASNLGIRQALKRANAG